MNHDITTNARILHTTLDKIRELKELLGFKTLFEAAEFIINEKYTSAPVVQIRENQKRNQDLLTQALGK